VTIINISSLPRYAEDAEGVASPPRPRPMNQHVISFQNILFLHYSGI